MLALNPPSLPPPPSPLPPLFLTSLSAAPVSDVLTEEKDMEAEFASWQAKLGPDFSALESALKPVERYDPTIIFYCIGVYYYLPSAFGHLFM